MARAPVIALVALLLLTALVYAPLRRAGFVYEDDHWIAAIQQPIALSVPPSRSLVLKTYQWTQRIVGIEPALYHLENVALHLVNGALVYALALTLVSPMAAVAAAGLFLLHPINVEAVAYLTARTDLLSTTGALLAVWLGLRFLTSGGYWRVLGICAGLLLAGTSKEIGLIAVPLLVFSLMAWRRGRTPPVLLLNALWGCGGLVLGLTWVRLYSWVVMADLVAGGAVLPWREFAPLQAVALWRLLLLVVWPVGFSIDHDTLALAAWGPTASALCVGAVLWVGLSAWRGEWSLGVWVTGWIAIALVPRFMFPSSEFVNEHQLYLAMSGLCVWLGQGVAWALACEGSRGCPVSTTS